MKTIDELRAYAEKMRDDPMQRDVRYWVGYIDALERADSEIARLHILFPATRHGVLLQPTSLFAGHGTLF